jgi:hypothetical protein
MEDNHAALVKEMQDISLANSEAHADRKSEIQETKAEAVKLNTDTKEVLRAEVNSLKTELNEKCADMRERVTILEASAS